MTNIQAIKRILREIIKPHLNTVLIAIVLMLLVAAGNAYQIYLIKPVLNKTLFNDGDPNDLGIPALIMLVSALKGITTYIQLVLSASISAKLINKVRLRLLNRFLNSDMVVFNNSSSAKMLSNVLSDVSGMMNGITVIISGVFKNTFMTIFLFIVMFVMSYKLTLIALVGFPLTIIPVYYVYGKTKKYMGRNQQQMEDFTILMDDSLRAAKTVKSYNAEKYESNRIEAALNKLYKLSCKIARAANIPGPMNETLAWVGISGVLVYGGNLVRSGHMDQAAFFTFFAALMSAYKPLKSLTGLNIQLQTCLVCAKRVFALLDVKPKIVDKSNAKKLENIKGNIEFRNVTFSYNDDQKNALDNINIKLEQGKSYALVGQSGGGKSTIMSLLLRFYDPKNGNILIDSNDIKDVTLHSLRDNISYVGQDVQLFDDSILENIRYNKSNATEEDVIRAAKLAEAHEFIMESPDEYNARVGQNGQKLSGGQRQRISIARAILKNSPILLLDEATSSLDPVSEELVQKAFEHLMKGKTTLTIAHRISTVMKADKIFILKNGQIIEQGKHDELLTMNGQYSILYSKQFQD